MNFDSAIAYHVCLYLQKILKPGVHFIVLVLQRQKRLLRDIFPLLMLTTSALLRLAMLSKIYFGALHSSSQHLQLWQRRSLVFIVW